MTSLRWVNSTESVSTVLKPWRFTSLTNASETLIAFMPKAGSRTSSPGTIGRLPSPTMTRNSPSRTSCVATTVPWILIW